MNRNDRRRMLREIAKKEARRRPPAERSEGKASIWSQAAESQELVESLPAGSLVAGVNNLLSQLETRGIPVMDWDGSGKQLYKLQIKRDKVYYLAARAEEVNEETRE